MRDQMHENWAVCHMRRYMSSRQLLQPFESSQWLGYGRLASLIGCHRFWSLPRTTFPRSRVLFMHSIHPIASHMHKIRYSIRLLSPPSSCTSPLETRVSTSASFASAFIRIDAGTSNAQGFSTQARNVTQNEYLKSNLSDLPTANNFLTITRYQHTRDYKQVTLHYCVRFVSYSFYL
jgi:hypothetical protein